MKQDVLVLSAISHHKLLQEKSFFNHTYLSNSQITFENIFIQITEVFNFPTRSANFGFCSGHNVIDSSCLGTGGIVQQGKNAFNLRP